MPCLGFENNPYTELKNNIYFKVLKCTNRVILSAAEAWKMKLMNAIALLVLNEFSFSENVSQEDNPRSETGRLVQTQG